MKPSTSADHLPSGLAAETHVLLALVRASLTRDGVSSFYNANLNWSALADLAFRNRLAGFVLRGLSANRLSVPDQFRAELERVERATVQMNGIGLLTLRHIVPILEKHGLKAVAIKGPMAQKVLYDNFFAKPSTDVDLLVAPAQYAHAAALLTGENFGLAKECASLWWTHFLGEQHFLSADRALQTIDLHHRIQQPGLPRPAAPHLFLSETQTIAIGAVPVPTLSSTYTCLLSCISLAKALMHREPAGAHVCDIAASMLAWSAEERDRCTKEARRQGLLGVYELGIRASTVLFGIDDDFDRSEHRRSLPTISDDALKGLVLFPNQRGVWHPMRSNLLWHLCDRKREFVAATAWRIGADLARSASAARRKLAS